MKIYRSETEVRISHTKKCDRQKRTEDRGHSCLEKALLALKIKKFNANKLLIFSFPTYNVKTFNDKFGQLLLDLPRGFPDGDCHGGDCSDTVKNNFI